MGREAVVRRVAKAAFDAEMDIALNGEEGEASGKVTNLVSEAGTVNLPWSLPDGLPL